MNGHHLRARVRVLAVLSADRYSVALIDNHGHRVKGDITIRLAGYSSRYITRPAEPPLRAAALYPTDGDGNAPAACPMARDAAAQLLDQARRSGHDIEATIPITGAGWLRSILNGDPVAGDLTILDAHRRPISERLATRGHLVPR